MSGALSACVGSGYCCKTAPCGYSQKAMLEEGKKWNTETGCRYLVLQYPKLLCGLYLGASEQEQQQMASITGMGVGAGCSSTLFNRDRERVISLLRSSSPSSGNSSGTP